MAPDYPKKGAGTGARKRTTPRTEFLQAVEAFMKVPFPERSDDEDADRLHADLLLHDSAVGDAVMAIINGEPVPADELRPDQDLRQRLEELAASDAAGAADANTYLDYLNGLDQLLELARQAKGKKKKR